MELNVNNIYLNNQEHIMSNFFKVSYREDIKKIWDVPIILIFKEYIKKTN